MIPPILQQEIDKTIEGFETPLIHFEPDCNSLFMEWVTDTRRTSIEIDTVDCRSHILTVDLLTRDFDEEIVWFDYKAGRDATRAFLTKYL